jgi:hypothetical protein
MNQEGFDHIIKGKLEGYNIEYPKTDIWDAYEQAAAKLDEQAASESFDNAVRDALVEQNVSYISAHWQLMKAQLKISEERKNTVYASKVLELAAIFLIVITAMYWPVYKNPVQPEKQRTTPEKIEYADAIIPQIDFSTQNTQELDHKQNASMKNCRTVSTEQSSLNHSYIYDHLDDHLDAKSDAAILDKSLTRSNVKARGDQDILNDMALKDQIEMENIAPVQDDYAAGTDHGIRSKSLDVVTLASLKNDELSSEYPRMIPMEFNFPKEKSKYYLGVISSADVNLINTPFDKVYSKASYTREALNHTLGLTISKRNESLEVETGAAYVKRAYQPETIRENLGNEFFYTQKTFNKIQFDILNLPLNIKYHFINQPKWSAYIMAGAALSLVMNADYAISEVQTLNRPTAGEYVSSESRLKEKPFIKGLLNNDNLKDNYFASLSFGFGIEKKIGSGTSLYIQPSYQRQVLSSDIGIGPNKDKIHSSSLAFGIKTVLN